MYIVWVWVDIITCVLYCIGAKQPNTCDSGVCRWGHTMWISKVGVANLSKKCLSLKHGLHDTLYIYRHGDMNMRSKHIAKENAWNILRYIVGLYLHLFFIKYLFCTNIRRHFLNVLKVILHHVLQGILVSSPAPPCDNMLSQRGHELTVWFNSSPLNNCVIVS